MNSLNPHGRIVDSFVVNVHKFVLLLLSLSITPAFLLGEGFGVNKLVVDLVRVHPPQFLLFADAVSVKASSPDPSKGAVAQRLQSAVQTVILSNHQRIASQSEQPDAVIELSLLESNVWETNDPRKKKEYKKVGEEQVWNSKKNQYETKDKYDYVEVLEFYKVLSGALTVNYRSVDSMGNPLDSYTFSARFRRDYKDGIGAPDILTVEGSMTAEVSHLLVRRLFPTDETLQVLLPRGSFEDLDKLAQEGQWNRYLESLNRFPPKRNLKEDAYRQYALGVAYEALAYKQEEVETTLRYLEQASVQYGKAMEANRDEKYFSEGWRDEVSPAERVRSGLMQYQKYSEFKAARDKRADSTSSTLPRFEESTRSLASGKVLKNADVIEMVKAGLSDQNVLLAIDAAEKADFDVTPEGLIQLAKAGVSNEIIVRLQKKKQPK